MSFNKSQTANGILPIPGGSRRVREKMRSRRRASVFLVVACAVSIASLFNYSGDLSTANVPSPGEEPDMSLGFVLKQSLGKAVRSGTAGFFAGAAQVIAFMWLRTTMNYQYVHGGSFLDTLKLLWAEGGIRRLYRGLFPWAIIQAPISRFGATAANQLVLGITGVYLPLIPIAATTILASGAGACWRIFVLPIDALKTTLQVKGESAISELKEKVKAGGIGVLYAGWEAMWIADLMGNYPWFVTNNLLSASLPIPTTAFLKIVRSAFVGVCASCASDTISNGMRVIKTKKQTSTDHNLGYMSAVKEIVALDGISGLLFRGLGTRLFTNMLQGAAFSVLWKSWSGEA